MLNRDETQMKTENFIVGSYVALRLIAVVKKALVRNAEEQIGG
ncbi:MAG: hypothetical protein UGF89_05455 [Acutalibacteraceae bacterium]|nr:hypothetical protein [Acutalibacteraceae bacterium]